VEIRSTVAWINQWKNPRDLRRLQGIRRLLARRQRYAARLGYRLDEFVSARI